MSISGLNVGLSESFGSSRRSIRYFDRGGTFDRVGGYTTLFARRFGRNLTGLTAPGVGLQLVGGAASNLSRAFTRRQDSTPESGSTTIDVVA